jgi:tetratricopeptide (TPR) repeat protein
MPAASSKHCPSCKPSPLITTIVKNLILFFLILACATVQSQSIPDDFNAKYRLAKTDEEKGRCINTYLGKINASVSDSNEMKRAFDLLAWFKKQNDETGADYTELFICYDLTFKGDFSAALNLSFPILSRFENRNDNYGVMHSNQVIGLAFTFDKNYEKASEHLKKAIQLGERIDPNGSLSSMYNDLGVTYALASMPDSGLIFAQKAVNMDTEKKDSYRLPISLSTLAENYMAAGEYDIAIPFLRKAMTDYLSREKNQDRFGIAYVDNDFAEAFLAKKNYDSANYHARRSIQLSSLLGFRDQTMRSYECLYKTFEATKQQDSVNKYFRLAMTAKDSLFSMEKARNIEAMSFREQLHQQEMQAEKINAQRQRRLNIEFILVGFGIISFFILFLLLSRSFITNTRIIKFLGIIALLIVFEFLNLLLHPFLERITDQSPALMLLALVCIAALLVPLHHRLEKWSINKLIEKNKSIRLAAAKKTIEQLEKNN